MYAVFVGRDSDNPLAYPLCVMRSGIETVDDFWKHLGRFWSGAYIDEACRRLAPHVKLNEYEFYEHNFFWIRVFNYDDTKHFIDNWGNIIDKHTYVPFKIIQIPEVSRATSSICRAQSWEDTMVELIFSNSNWNAYVIVNGTLGKDKLMESIKGESKQIDTLLQYQNVEIRAYYRYKNGKNGVIIIHGWILGVQYEMYNIPKALVDKLNKMEKYKFYRC